MRKTIFLFIAIFFLISCETVKFIPKSTSVEIIDFKKYLNKNFLITPYDYKGDYESIGMIHATLMPSANLISMKKYSEVTSDTMVVYQWKTDTIKTSEALDTIYSKAVQMGADAIIDLSINSNRETYNIGSSKEITIFGIIVDGFAIKRKGAFIPLKEELPLKDTLSIEK